MYGLMRVLQQPYNKYVPVAEIKILAAGERVPVIVRGALFMPRVCQLQAIRRLAGQLSHASAEVGPALFVPRATSGVGGVLGESQRAVVGGVGLPSGCARRSLSGVWYPQLGGPALSISGREFPSGSTGGT